jgi:hypothetical protein
MVETVVDMSNCECDILGVYDQVAMAVPVREVRVSLYTSFSNQTLICY